MKLYSPWEKTFDKITTPFEDFLHAQTTTGLVLMLMALIALFLANSPYADTYINFFHTKICQSTGRCVLEA